MVADMTSRPPAGTRDAPVALTAAQTRVINTALELFTRHGVGATSLQMIADEIGVTKAAVYHQFRTKDEIVLAAAKAELTRLDEVIVAAEREPSRERSQELLLEGMVGLAVEGRRRASAILHDPAVVAFFPDHAMFRHVMHRLRDILVGETAGAEGRVRVAMLVAAISGAVMHPFVADVDGATLRAELLRLAHRWLDES